MCIICRNEYKGLNRLDELTVRYCPKIVQIPNIQGLDSLYICLFNHNTNSKYTRIK